MNNTALTGDVAVHLDALSHNPVIDALARQTGFVKRKPRKLYPGQLLLTLIHNVLEGTMSFALLAQRLGATLVDTISKQDIHQRMNAAMVRFLQAVLAYVMAQQLHGQAAAVIAKATFFGRILVQDSTNVPLPPNLAPFYPSGQNQTGKAFATCKIQAVFDLLTERFVYCFLSPYTETEQRLGSQLLAKWIQPGDLLVRDLGYFTFAALHAIEAAGAYFLSRLNVHYSLFDPVSGKRLSLLKMLRQLGTVDCPVLLGIEQTPVRLVALPVSPPVAARRRQKARTNRDRRLHPSKERLALMGWNIYVLNVPSAMLSPTQIETLYGLRWHIETLFKIWKSEFRLHVPQQHVSLFQAQAIIVTMLIIVTLFHRIVIPAAVGSQQQGTGGTTVAPFRLSIVKLARLCKELFLDAIAQLYPLGAATKNLLHLCRCDKRNDRLNYYQQLYLALS